MELRHLRYFQAVAEELSFSKAARRLRIAQPAVSRAVQELERFTGARLIDRNRRTLRLTPAGAILLRDTAILFERIEETLRRVQRTAAGVDGELRLGYIGPPTRSFLGPLLQAFHQSHPGVSVTLEERTPERVWEMVSQARLSIGLTRPVIAHEALGLRSLTLKHERLCAAVPTGHRLAGKATLPWKSIATESVILLARREGAGSHDAIQAACREAGFVPRIVHTPSTIGTILQYVEAGAGIGIVPESALPDASNTTRLIPLKPTHTIPLVMVWAREGEDPAVNAFRDLVKQWLSDGRI